MMQLSATPERAHYSVYPNNFGSLIIEEQSLGILSKEALQNVACTQIPFTIFHM